MSIDDIKVFLPKYLSPEAEETLFEDLKQFPINIDKRLYTSRFTNTETIFQGDGLEELLFVNLPEPQIGKGNGMVLSNTCDISPENKRFLPPSVVYAPIHKLGKYKAALLEANVKADQVDGHIDSIRKQKVSSVFYLPQGGTLEEESIVFLDRLNSCNVGFLEGRNISKTRLFTLSDYGLYLFLFKLSVHLTRIHEGIERGSDTVPVNSDH
ncbi:MAG: hypothetical protein CVU64_17190 [Deltaproteobacteria bacterium HGW-Deltaproteobacteria-21]|nr:MAG: hypothetical protein CVU64_17190 [Deltaproteobacteria bacterium HGW-Deltaproteobacteria-21]